jgi:hypothetical protein
MSGRWLLVFLWFGVLLLVTHLANGQQNYGQVQGRLAQGTKHVEVIGRIGLQQVASGALCITMPVTRQNRAASYSTRSPYKPNTWFTSLAYLNPLSFSAVSTSLPTSKYLNASPIISGCMSILYARRN